MHNEPLFPAPLRIRGRRFWRESEIINYERALAGLPPSDINPADDRLIQSADVRERFGGVSEMWLWRRISERAATVAV